jgi:hypothetical protein
MRLLIAFFSGIIMLLVPVGVEAGAQKPARARFATRWAAEVGPGNALPDYPRPMMVRKEWLNLNGLWEYAITPAGVADSSKPDRYSGTILVPFCVESSLSGVGHRLTPSEALWYRRFFELPKNWRGRRILLHFGAVDWECRVRVNGREAGSHKGGYDPFHFDVTDLLKDGANELLVYVKDPTSSGNQPRGKQMDVEGGIFYTSTSGIWQTVWIEPVSSASVESLIIVPDVDRHRIGITVVGRGTTGTDRILLAVKAGGKTIAQGKGGAGEAIEMDIKNAELWSPDSPFLYDLTVDLERGGKVVDRVEGYFAMRKISVGRDPDGVPRILLNNKPLFQLGLLDQGFWPDGVYTAPTDEALRYDIEVTKKLGLNLIRKHVKIEPERWYYHCDKLGVLVWQDMPNGPTEKSEESRTQFRAELKAMIDARRNHPSIIVWIPFNEGWGQHDSVAIADWIKAYDPSRLVTEASGWNDNGAGDLRDVHSYPAPDFYEIVHSRPMPEPESRRAIVIGESGGVGVNIPGHLWKEGDGWGWLNLETPQALTDFYAILLSRFHQLIPRGLCAAVYTQTTDIETECNGLMTYDREVIKMDVKQALDAARAIFQTPPPVFTTLVPTSLERPQEWKYTTEGQAEGWTAPAFDDRGWKTGTGVFGSERDKKNIPIGTVWKDKEIYLRRTFILSRVPGEFGLRICHDEDAEIYINGKLVKIVKGWKERDGFLTALKDVVVGPGAQALREGENTLAVHSRQTGGSQTIDVGLLEVDKK